MILTGFVMAKEYNYSDYWKNEFDSRKKYYNNLYGKFKDFYVFPENLVLDVGGGNGQLAKFLQIKNPLILDVSDSGLRFAKEKFGFKVIKTDLTREWNLNKNFNCVLCNECLEHLDKPLETLNKINNVLNIGGIAYISVPNMIPDGEHHKSWIYYRKLKTILNKSGFKIENKIIVPRFEKIKTPHTIKERLYSFISVLLSKNNEKITNLFPSIFGRFYHIKARKIKELELIQKK